MAIMWPSFSLSLFLSFLFFFFFFFFLFFCTRCFLLESLEHSVSATWKKLRSFLFFQKVRKPKFFFWRIPLPNKTGFNLLSLGFSSPPPPPNPSFLTYSPRFSFYSLSFSLFHNCLCFGEGNLQPINRIHFLLSSGEKLFYKLVKF